MSCKHRAHKAHDHFPEQHAGALHTPNRAVPLWEFVILTLITVGSKKLRSIMRHSWTVSNPELLLPLFTEDFCVKRPADTERCHC